MYHEACAAAVSRVRRGAAGVLLALPTLFAILVVLSLSAFSPAFSHALNLLRSVQNDEQPPAQQLVTDEESLEALFVWQFLQFTEWTMLSSVQEGFVVGVMGTTRVASFLDEQARKRPLPDGTTVQVRRVTTPDDAEKCRVLYIAPSTDATKASQTLARIRYKSVLSVGHDDRFLERGGIINIYNESDRLRFQINLVEANNSKLKLSAKILRLGKLYNR
jgi:transcription-repair coupling factor (superfamily II helicase)